MMDYEGFRKAPGNALRFYIDFSPAQGLFNKDEFDPEYNNMEIVVSHVCDSKRPLNKTAVTFEMKTQRGPFSVYTYLPPEAAKGLGDALARLTGCAWYDPTEDD